MDKLLLAAFLSALAGFITAIISFVKLVNEKEGKISESRQAWNESVRKSFAELTSKIYAMAANFEEQSTFGEIVSENEKLLDAADDPEKKSIESAIEQAKHNLKIVQEDIQSKRHDMHLSYAYTKLHFKPGDVSFNRIEQKYDLIDTLMDTLFEEADYQKRVEIRAKIDGHIKGMVDIGRDILKTEWEVVKKGEPAYKQTIRFAAWGGMVMLFILVSIGIHAFISVSRTYQEQLHDSKFSKANETSDLIKASCWRIENISGQFVKFNSCTGESADLTSKPK